MNKKLKIAITMIIACIIIVGAIITFTMGFNVDLIYSKNKQVTISIGKEFNIEDIRDIIKEVTNQNKMILEKVELYEDMVSIKLEDITNEQLEAINSKINEKYEIENSVDSLAVVENSNVRLRDLVKEYIYPIILSFVLIIVYLVVYMFINAKLGNKLNIIENVIKLTLSIILSQSVLFGLIAILRIPVNRLTIPCSLTLYAITTIVFMVKLQNNYKKIENKKNKN